MNLKTNDLELLRLPELWARFAEAVGAGSRSPNKTFLIRKIREATAAEPPEREPALDEESALDAAAPSPVVERPADLRRLPLADLQARYLEVVGRPTSSVDAAYLAWKVREVQKGRIAPGTTRRQTAGEPADMKVLPLRLPAATVDALDGAVQRLRFGSRMAFLRAALGGYLEQRGEVGTARLLTTDGGEA